MEINEAVNYIEKHNKWRRGEIDTDAYDLNPRLLGFAIDVLVEYVKKSLNESKKNDQAKKIAKAGY
jgi:hypothetical protein